MVYDMQQVINKIKEKHNMKFYIVISQAKIRRHKMLLASLLFLFSEWAIALSSEKLSW
jgi:hypothetical protein